MTRWGVLFDWDGVLVDSSSLHERSWELLAAEEGLPLPPDHFKRGYGMKNEVIIPELLRWSQEPAEIRRLSLRKEELFRQLARGGGLSLLPGVRALLRKLGRRGIPRAIASSTHRLNIETAIEALKLGGFSAIVTAEDVTRGKPDPEVFVKAAERLGLPPKCCVVFEDTHAGIQAARSAGAGVIAVATTHPAELLTDADTVVTRLDKMSINEIERVALDRTDGRGRRDQA